MKNSQAVLAIGICISLGALIALAGSQGSVQPFRGIPLFAICGAIGFVLHWLVFIPSYAFQTEHYFDLTGSASFIVTALFAFYFSPAPDTRTLILTLAIVIWAFRLGGFLFIRVKRVGQDSRFNEIKTRFWRFCFTWTLGGLWVLLTMAAPLAAMTSATKLPLEVTSYVGIALWLAGLVFEAVADHQKTVFRNDPVNKDKFINHGLWAWSRHPNYFGEIILWLGLSLVALPVLQGWQLVTMISPFFVTLLLTRVSGIPLLEQKADKRWGQDPAYQSYKETTPVLIPRPPR